MSKRRNAVDAVSDDLKPILENDYAWITNNPLVTNVYHVYLNEQIESQRYYRDIFNCLRTATSDDYFIIYINNFGGYLHTMVDIVASMKECKGTILVRVTGPIYSCAPLIALAGHKLILEENAFFMFHDYSGSEEGKGHEMKSSVEHFKPYWDDMFTRLTKKFLTSKEQKSVLKGQDLYLTRAESMKRLKRMGKLMKEVK